MMKNVNWIVSNNGVDVHTTDVSFTPICTAFDKQTANFIACSPEMLKSLEQMKWFVDHIMGKEKRVNWGNTFNIDWGKVNEALINLDATIAKAKG